MQHSKKGRFLLAHGRPLLMALCVIFLSMTGLSTRELTYVQAASRISVNNPSVIIARDVTNSSCFRTIVNNAGTSQATTTHAPCLPGTLITLVMVPRSQAQALHEPYVLAVSPSASQILQQRMAQQVAQLAAAKRAALQGSFRTHNVTPSTSCGGTSIVGTSETLHGDIVSGDVYYQRSYSCNSLVLDWARAEGYTAVNPLFWSYFDDYNRSFPVPNCSYVGTNTIYDNIDVTGVPVGSDTTFVFFNLYCLDPNPKVTFYLYVGPLN